jgi:hypothetical protein
VSWKHGVTLAISDALTAIRQVTITPSQAVNATAPTSSSQVVQIWFEPDPAPTPAGAVAALAPSTIFTIHGTAVLNTAGLVWSRKDDDAILTKVFVNGGRVLIRLHCGMLISTDGRNFSAALDTLTQQASPHVPGGVFESWFFVKGG